MQRRLLQFRRNKKARGRRISRGKWQGGVEGLERRQLLTSGYVQLNLVSDQAGVALIQDANLVNPAGIALATSGGDFWVSDTGSGVTTLYGGDVAGSAFSKSSLVVSVPGGSPTGQVFNGATGFTVQSGTASASATFILDSLGGEITGWNTAVPAPGSTQAEAAASTSGAEFTGLAEGTVGTNTFLYAADFHGGKIDVFDSSFAPATLTGTFSDPNIPAGFAPYNIQDIGGNLFVTYAKQDASKETAVAGAGNGFVDEFSTNGTILHSLVAGNQLNAPWGIAIAPATFGDLQGDLLVANTGDGKINAFNPSTGAFVNTLNDASGNPITISGLHGLSFGNGVSAGDTSTLYFTADPSSGQHGLFGELESATLDAVGASITATEGAAFSGVVATFDSPTAGAQASGFTANIVWGDGSITAGTISANASAGFDVTGNHTYAEDGTDPLSIIISAVAPGTATATATGSALVLEGAFTSNGATFAATAGTTFNGKLATFSDPGSTDSSGEFIATVNWGDGATTSATVTGSSGNFTVNGSHSYVNGGVFAPIVLIAETAINSGPVATITATANVTGTDTLAATGTAIAATEGASFTKTVATFTDSNATTAASALTATINWGDGTTTTGSVTGANGSYTVSGNHTYAEDGTQTVSVSIAENAPGTATATATSTASILEGDLTGTGATFSATEAQSFSGNVATFDDAGSAATSGSFTAAINWGDGTTTAGTVSGSPGSFTVNGSHTYSDGGVFTTSVSITETGVNPAPAATLTGTANVTDTDTLVATSTAIAASEGISFTGAVATFTDSNATTVANDLIATINWGDGSSSAGTVNGSNGNFTVNASHIYGDEGTFNTTVVVADDAVGGGTSTAANTATVAESDTLTPGPITFTPTEGTSFSGTVATFNSTNTAGQASDFVATINWGDGTTTAGTVAGTNGAYTVSGTHAYAADGTQSVTVSIADDAPGTATATAGSTANILEGDLTGTGATFSATEGTSFSGNVATFVDAGSTATAASFTATIDWGDGSGTSTGSVSGSPGAFTVAGTHTFTDGGAFPVHVFITETGISPAPAATVTALANVPDTDVLAATATAAISQTESQAFNGTVATFSDGNLATASSDFIATIVWGDGGTSPGTISGANGQFTVTASHVYLDEGTFTAQVTVADDAPGGPSATATNTATIAEGDQLLGVSQTFQATAGTSFSGAVATFRDNSTFNSASDFSAVINWGDGATTPGTVSGNGGTFTVSGTHTYLQDGSIGVAVTFSDDAPSTAKATANSTAHIASAGLTVKSASVSATERTAFSGTVATFTDPGTSDTSTQFTATINWGDGSSSAGTVSGSGGSFSVAGGHTFTEEGGSTVTVQVTDTISAPTATFSESSTVNVLDADVLAGSGRTISAVEGHTFNGTVATFTDVSTTAAATDFTATINWGDGSSSTGTVSGSAGTFTVGGSHSYATGGTDSVTVKLVDDPPGTATATATGTAQVAGATLTATAVNVTVTQGDVASAVTVATFIDSDVSTPASAFTATVNWGDGSSSTGTVSGSAGTFTVTGSHTYADPGHFALTVAIQEQGGGTASASPTAVIGSNNERYIAQLYRDLLGREGEPAGMTFWETQISQGESTAAIATGFLGSLEFRLDVANELYQTYLQRPADLTGVNTAAQALLTNTPEQEAAVLVSSTEFFTNQAFGTSAGFLTALYSDALHRQVDAAAQLNFGAMNIADPTVRAQIAAQVFGSAEYQTDLINSPSHTTQKYNQGVPIGFYQTFLQRNADSAGLAVALAQYKAGQTDSQVIDTILASNEYFANL